jgi:hypothetical protein
VSFCWFSLRIVNIGSRFSIERYMDINQRRNSRILIFCLLTGDGPNQRRGE